MDTEWKALADKLPKQPRDDLIQDIMSAVYDDEELGENLILYHRESVELADERLLLQTMGPEDWARYDASVRRRWGARCTCSNCGEDFLAGYVRREGLTGIVLAADGDGNTQPGVPSAEEGCMEYFDGEPVQCPTCCNEGRLTRRSDLRSGRTHQVMQAETVSVDGCTAVMFWLVSRRQDDAGTDQTLFLPNSALLVDKGGKLRRFRAVRQGGEVTDVEWVPCTRTRDPMQVAYYDHASANYRKVGGWTCVYGPDLAGQTGEKTALDKYIGAGGHWPGAYLHVWKQHPQVENLMRQGFAAAVQEPVDGYLDTIAYSADLRDAPAIDWVDWSQCRPHKMLGMSLEAFRAIRAAGGWHGQDAACWARYRAALPGADALEFDLCRQALGCAGVAQLLDAMAEGWPDLRPARVARYLERHGPAADGVQMLLDYRRMLRDAGLAEAEEALWPRDLMAAHDRVVRMWAGRSSADYTLGFTSVYLSLRDLEWTDGDLCVVIPRSEQDLIEEGRVLRHCVGTYGRPHCSGKPVFFIRHRRRPERSYYTLNIDLTGKLPREIQLHGYGNERHGPAKQYTHSIPRAVRDFCDRWQREVLLPWFAARRERESKPVGQSRRRAG